MNELDFAGVAIAPDQLWSIFAIAFLFFVICAIVYGISLEWGQKHVKESDRLVNSSKFWGMTLAGAAALALLVTLPSTDRNQAAELSEGFKGAYGLEIPVNSDLTAWIIQTQEAGGGAPYRTEVFMSDGDEIWSMPASVVYVDGHFKLYGDTEAGAGIWQEFIPVLVNQ